MMKYILILIFSIEATEQLPEWYDTKAECVSIAEEAVKEIPNAKYSCVPVKY